MKILFRVDDRLIHGQTITSWCTKYDIKNILVINDEISSDPLKQIFYKAAITPDINLTYSSLEDSPNNIFSLEKALNNSMVICENIHDINTVLNKLNKTDIISDLFIGHLKFNKNKIKHCDGIYLSDNEHYLLSKLSEDFNFKIHFSLIV